MLFLVSNFLVTGLTNDSRAAKLLEQSGESPVDLRVAVTSPGGTTQAALETFEAAGLRQLVARAATAAHDRSIELSK